MDTRLQLRSYLGSRASRTSKLNLNVKRGANDLARRNEGLMDLLTILPWWVSGFLAAGVFFSSHYIIPKIQFENFFYKALAPNAPLFGNMFSVFLVGCAVLSAINSLIKAKRLDSQKDLDSIRDLGWKEFEELVGEAYLRKGYHVVENQGAGPDGGIDLVLRKLGMTTLIQCKHWKTMKVGVKVVRELFGVMTAKGAERGIVIVSGEFTKEAVSFAESNSIELVNGPRLLAMISEVQKDPRIEKPVAQSAQKECPGCGSELVVRVAKKGQHAGTKFWGCSNYPKCRKIVRFEG